MDPVDRPFGANREERDLFDGDVQALVAQVAIDPLHVLEDVLIPVGPSGSLGLAGDPGEGRNESNSMDSAGRMRLLRLIGRASWGALDVHSVVRSSAPWPSGARRGNESLFVFRLVSPASMAAGGRP